MYKRLSLFVNYLHELKFTSKSSGIYQLLHLSGLMFGWLFALVYYGQDILGYQLVGTNLERSAVIGMMLITIVFNIWYVFFRDKTMYFYDHAKKIDLIIGFVFYVLSWVNVVILLMHTKS